MSLLKEFSDEIRFLHKNTQVDDFLQGGYGVHVSSVVENKESRHPFVIMLEKVLFADLFQKPIDIYLWFCRRADA